MIHLETSCGVQGDQWSKERCAYSALTPVVLKKSIAVKGYQLEKPQAGHISGS